MSQNEQNKEGLANLKVYITFKESSWFRLSLAFIVLFFMFSWVTSENILVLFTKRVTTLIFAFFLPGYLITKTIYPKKNEIDVIEQFAFSVAFSITFIIFISYILNYVWAITPFSLAITTFLFALIFAFTAILRSFHIYGQNSDSKNIEKKEFNFKKEVLPLILIGVVFFIIKSYEPITSARVGWMDPYYWSYVISRIILEGHVTIKLYPFELGYPPGFSFLTTFLTIFLATSSYDTIRYAHIFSFLTIIPAYLFARHVFNSTSIAFLSIVFMFSTRWMFLRTSISNPESISHFLVVLFLLMFLKAVENPSTKNCLITSLLLTSTILEYNMPIQFLVPFILLIFTFFYIKHLRGKTGFTIRETVKTASLIVIPAALFSGVIWYFWNFTRLLRTQRLSNPEMSQITFSDIFLSRDAFVDFVYHVRHIGLFEAIFSLVGLMLIILNINHRKETRYQFLIIYFFTILLLIQSNYFGVKGFHIWYLFSWLAFPASMLAGYGFFNSIKLIRGQLKKLVQPSINFPNLKSILLGLGIILILLVNFNGYNYHWYNHDESKVYPFEWKERIFSDPRIYQGLQKRVNENGFLSSYLYRGHYYGFYYPFYYTQSEFEAFSALKEIMPPAPDSWILSWMCDHNFLRGVSEREVLFLERLIDGKVDFNSSDILRRSLPYKREKFILLGLKRCPKFSSETLVSIAQDPNFKLVYQNKQVKIYKILPSYIFPLRQGGFTDNFTDTFHWGTDLNESNVLRTDGDIATYKAQSSGLPIDVDFSTGLDTKTYPYFESRMKVGSGKISIGVYDSTGKEHMFLKDYTTNGKWETYKFNLHDWLTRDGYETDIYGIKITNTLGDDPSFNSSFDWISIHNHVFWDMFEEESKVSDTVNVSITNGYVTLSKKIEKTLSNGGFENDFRGWGPRAKWSLDVGESHSGNKSAVLRGTVDPAKDGSAYLDTEIYRGVLKPNTPYRFSVWIKGNVTSAVRGFIRQIGSTGPWPRPPIVYFTKGNKTYNNWTYHEEIITTHVNISDDFFIRFYGGGDPAVWIDDISFGEEVYESSGLLVSTKFSTENPIISVTPTWSSVEPDKNINLTIEVSVNNGTTWTRAENGKKINYGPEEPNKYILYRAFFQTNDSRKSPILHDINLVYKEQFPEQ